MKALTLTQPWASLVAWGEKRIETRSWSASYRGPIAIHAAKGWPKWAMAASVEEPFRSTIFRHGSMHRLDNERGHVLATATLTRCLPTQMFWVPEDGDDGALRQTPVPGALNAISAQEWAFGDYSLGRFAFILADVRPLPEPVPARGMLGLWDWTA